MRVTIAGTRIVIFDTGSLSLREGQIRTVFFVESLGGGAPYGLLPLSDRK